MPHDLALVLVGGELHLAEDARLHHGRPDPRTLVRARVGRSDAVAFAEAPGEGPSGAVRDVTGPDAQRRGRLRGGGRRLGLAARGERERGESQQRATAKHHWGIPAI